MTSAEPWKRLTNEGTKPYSYFWDFLSLPQPRPSLHIFAQRYEVGDSVLRRYSSRFNWMPRVEAWDARIQAVEVETIMLDRKQLAEKQSRALGMCRELGEIAILDHLERARKARENAEGVAITMREALALVRDTAALERLVIGEATEIIETGPTDFDTSKLTGDEAETLLSLIAKMKAT